MALQSWLVSSPSPDDFHIVNISTARASALNQAKSLRAFARISPESAVVLPIDIEKGISVPKLSSLLASSALDIPSKQRDRVFDLIQKTYQDIFSKDCLKVEATVSLEDDKVEM